MRYIGAPVAAVAATSPAAAEEALRLIRVDYHSLPFVADMDAARAPNAALVYDSAAFAPQGDVSGYPAPAGLPLVGNVRGPAVVSRGDVARGFAEAETVVEAEYCTQVQTHCCLEPHAIVADWRADGVTGHISTQCTADVRQELAELFGLPLNRVRVIVDAIGGGFGSKASLGNYGRIAGHASRQARAPVRIALNREERTDRLRQSARNRSALADRRSAGRYADGDRACKLRDGWRRPRSRRRLLRPTDLHLSQFRERAVRRVHQHRARRGDARTGQHAGGLLGSSKRSTSFPNGFPSIRWCCATESTRVRYGARSDGSERSGSTGSDGTRRAPISVL